MKGKNVVFTDDNKKQLQFIEAVFSGKYRTLLFGGAIRGGKTYVGIAILILLCKMFPGSRWAIIRKDLKRLRRNTRPPMNKFISGTNVKINETEQTFTFENGSVIMFIGENYDKDKTLEAFKGLEINGALLEEVSEITFSCYTKVKERAGTYVITPVPKAGQPPPLVLMTCNPTQTWVKGLIYDPWKNGTLPSHMFYLPSYVTDNPHMNKEYLESLKDLPIYDYEVFVLGNWDITLKTKNAFWHALNVDTHLSHCEYDDNTTIHVSIDSNTMPYCAASIWQVYPNSKRVIQIAEITARDPHNHASGLGHLVLGYLNDIEYNDIVYLYGDATTKNQNTIDEKKRSFFDIFLEEVTSEYKIIDCFGRKNPQVAKTGEFVNALYSCYGGWSVLINEICKESLSDYLTVKKDMDGTMLKKRITDEDGNSYEEYGHLSDTKRYFLYECLNDVYHKWDDRFSEPEEAVMVEIDDDDLFGE